MIFTLAVKMFHETRVAAMITVGVGVGGSVDWTEVDGYTDQ
jgi:hypothetical protein